MSVATFANEALPTLARTAAIPEFPPGPVRARAAVKRLRASQHPPGAPNGGAPSQPAAGLRSSQVPVSSVRVPLAGPLIEHKPAMNSPDERATGDAADAALGITHRLPAPRAFGTIPLWAGKPDSSLVGDVVGKHPGKPLDPAVRSDMENRLGTDFSGVRVHDNDRAAASANSVQAHAYTVGNEIVFNRAAYAPDTDTGRRRLAHELVHVMQQRSGPVAGTDVSGGISLSDPTDRFEREAEAIATSMAAGPNGPLGVSTPQLSRSATPTRLVPPALAHLHRSAGNRNVNQLMTATGHNQLIAQRDNDGNRDEEPRSIPLPTFPVIEMRIEETTTVTAEGEQSKVAIVLANGQVLAGTGDTDLAPGSYDLVANASQHQWEIQKSGIKAGFRFDVTIDGIKDPFLLNFPPKFRLQVGSDRFDFPTRSTNLYVDNFIDVFYDLDYRNEKGDASKWLSVLYFDSATGVGLDIHFDEINDRAVPTDQARNLINQGEMRLGNRVVPREMNRTTTPRLWSAKQKALEVMGNNLLLFMEGSFPAVFFVITVDPFVAPLETGGRAPSATSERISKAGKRTSQLPSLGGPGAAPATTAEEVGQLVTAVRGRVGRVVINVGGRGAPGEPVDVINVNPERFKDPFPNQVLAKGEQMKDLFPAGSADEIVSRNLVGAIDWAAMAQSAYYVLRSGARATLRPWAGQLGDIPEIVEAMIAAGFTNVVRELSPVGAEFGVTGVRAAAPAGATLPPGAPPSIVRPSVPVPGGDTGSSGPTSVAP